MKFSRIASLISLIALAACGGGGSDVPTYDQTIDRTQTLFRKYENSTITEAMPTSGSATYRGTAVFAQDENSVIEMVSQVQLNASFSDSSISGRFHSFRDYDDALIPGTIEISSADGIQDSAYLGTLSGRLDGEKVDGVLAGAFVENDAKGTIGFVQGSVGNRGIFGIYAAEK